MSHGGVFSGTKTPKPYLWLLAEAASPYTYTPDRSTQIPVHTYIKRGSYITQPHPGMPDIFPETHC